MSDMIRSRVSDWYEDDAREWIDFENVEITYIDGEDLVRELEWLDQSDWDTDDVIAENVLQVWAICLICGNSVASCVCD